MATQQVTRPATLPRGTDPGQPSPARSARREEVPLATALRGSAQRRRARADSLLEWSREVHPPLSRSLRRRAAELELGAVALELRADGLDGGTTIDEEDQR